MDDGMRGLYGPGRDFGRDGGPSVPPEYWMDDDEPDDFDLDDESLFAQDPERFLHPDDFEHAPEAEPWDTPIYHPRTPGADYPEDTDPAEWEDREEEYAHENHRGHIGKQTPVGGILTQAEQWPDRCGR